MSTLREYINPRVDIDQFVASAEEAIARIGRIGTPVISSIRLRRDEVLAVEIDGKREIVMHPETLADLVRHAELLEQARDIARRVVREWAERKGYR